ncbi:PucR family transcriptional regulator [Peribacillus cavernae]|uniref:PucR family transcriptional regulator n=1 Tax=Peribacillus cavernae TaxID=1674310 RepID=A0A3S0VFD8_9BACI|nr:helix-turn-helix domain-containing protein [Peribacillus cavernae]MDQ0219896.1 DNA-binding PucR family transcriptional regulator [Peribacillus cavernae]RUQ26620.1 PucR family transcriptional regulator [Peribacillus cavernae]
MQESKKREVFKGVFGDLMEFADRISSVLDCPVTVEDGNHRLLAYSTHGETTDQARISTIIGRRVPEKVINSLWKEGVLPALLKDEKPILVQSIEDVGLGKRAAISIRKNDEVLGFIWALEINKPFSEEDMDFLQLAAKEAKNQLLQLQLRKKRKEEGHEEFFWQLLTGHYQNEQEITAHLSQFSLQVPALFSVLVFEFADEITRDVERYISYMLTTTQKIKPYFFTTDHNRLILLIGAENTTGFPASISEFVPYFITQMKSRFHVSGITGAAGGIYQKLSEGMHSYQEALYTLKIKQAFPEDTETMTQYKELGIYQSLDMLVKSQYSETGNVSISMLTAYDAKNQTDLLQTLQVYLEKDCNPNEAAKQLHIHVNTLNYRLKRITDIGEINLKDPLQKMSLFLGFKLKQYEIFLKKTET